MWFNPWTFIQAHRSFHSQVLHMARKKLRSRMQRLRDGQETRIYWVKLNVCHVLSKQASSPHAYTLADQKSNQLSTNDSIEKYPDAARYLVLYCRSWTTAIRLIKAGGCRIVRRAVLGLESGSYRCYLQLHPGLFTMLLLFTLRHGTAE